MDFWKRGEKTKFAKMANIATQSLSDILSRRRGVSYKTALIFERVSRDLLGETRIIPVTAWLGNKTTKHLAFRAL